MKRLLKISGLVGVLLFVLVGCSVPIYNVQNNAITTSKSNNAIYNAIDKGAKNAYWRIEKIGQNEVFAHFKIRNHKATVKITYDDTKYSINYHDGINLTFDPVKGTIHENYNKWVQSLEKSINIEVEKLK